MSLQTTSRALRRFFRRQSGATAVEFAILLPVLLGTFGAIVESSRIYWNYQGAVAGVREASRYIARVAPEQICGSSGSSDWVPFNDSDTVLDGDGGTLSYSLKVKEILDRNLSKGDGPAELPSGVTLMGRSVSYYCVAGAPGTYRTLTVPVVRVDATVQIKLPFATLFRLFGVQTEDITTTITDQSRVMGI